MFFILHSQKQTICTQGRLMSCFLFFLGKLVFLAYIFSMHLELCVGSMNIFVSMMLPTTLDVPELSGKCGRVPCQKNNTTPLKVIWGFVGEEGWGGNGSQVGLWLWGKLTTV